MFHVIMADDLQIIVFGSLHLVRQSVSSYVCTDMWPAC